MRTNIVAVVVALAVGVGGGYLIGSAAPARDASHTDLPSSSVVVSTRSTSEAPQPEAPNQPSDEVADAPATAARAAIAPASTSLAASPSPECEALEKEVAALRTMVIAERAARQDTEGKPIPFSPDVDAKFRAPALMTSFDDAARVVGTDARIEDVDCSELPCLMYGAVGAGNAGAEATRNTLISLMHTMEEDYAGAGKWFSSSTFEPGIDEPGETYLRFTLSFYPSQEPGSAEQEALNKRMRFRRDQYNASAPGAPE